jgi:thiamine kinase-like enzyme
VEIEVGYMISIERVVSLIPEWQNKEFSYQALSGGLTNMNYCLEIESEKFFVRIPCPQTEILAVDRENEYFNSTIASQVGVGPKVVHYLKEYNVMIMEFIKGKTLSNMDICKPGIPTRIAQSLRLLHSGPRFLHDFNMFRLIEYYLEVVKEKKVKIPQDYVDRIQVLTRIEQSVNTRRLGYAPCHNDLVAENFIDDGNILRIVDFEYSGNNDPCFDIGDAATEMALDEYQIEEICDAYFGKVYPSLMARIHLLGLVSDIGWVLWTAIQNQISKIDFNYWNHMMFRWERASSVMDSEYFPRWLVNT